MEITPGNCLNAARAAAAIAWVRGSGSTRKMAEITFVGLGLYPTLRRNCSWHGPVVRRFRTTERAVWLTIDDGPDARSDYLELLSEHRAKASFFVVGRRVDAFRPAVRRMVEDGHTVENHSYSHPVGSWWAMPPWRIRSEIDSCSHAIRVAAGASPVFFRSPVGMCNPWVHAAARRAGLVVVGWSASGGDGCRRAPTDIVDRIFRKISPGAIVLLHSGGQSRHRSLTLSLLLRRLAAEGYACVLPPVESLE